MYAHYNADFMRPREALCSDPQNQTGRKTDKSLNLTEGWV